MPTRYEFERLGAERADAVRHLLVDGERLLDHGLAKLDGRGGFVVLTTRKLIHVDERTDEKTLVGIDTIEHAEYRNQLMTATAWLDTRDGATVKVNGGKIFIPRLTAFLTAAIEHPPERP